MDTGKVCIVYFETVKSQINVPSGSDATSCQNVAKALGADYYSLACLVPKAPLEGKKLLVDEAAVDADKPVGIPCKW